ncbi:MAG: hypothetical protein HC817_02610 [Saprospiraceae bacterium]|nr:hypothetical protein [Saprospiraceae bacterium]
MNPSATAQRWTRYGLDLSELVKKDPTAVYQVRIGFRRLYVNYNCTGASAQDDLKGMTVLESKAFEDDNTDDANDSWENRASIMRYDWNGGEKNVEYDWQQRTNPCNAQYYNQDHFVSRNVFASDLGLIAKRGGDGSIFRRCF